MFSAIWPQINTETASTAFAGNFTSTRLRRGIGYERTAYSRFALMILQDLMQPTVRADRRVAALSIDQSTSRSWNTSSFLSDDSPEGCGPCTVYTRHLTCENGQKAPQRQIAGERVSFITLGSSKTTARRVCNSIAVFVPLICCSSPTQTPPDSRMAHMCKVNLALSIAVRKVE